MRVTVRRRNGTIVEAVRRLDEAGVDVDDLALRRPTLDDVFLSLTGHAAEEAEDERARSGRHEPPGRPTRSSWPSATSCACRAPPTCCSPSRSSR